MGDENPAPGRFVALEQFRLAAADLGGLARVAPRRPLTLQPDELAALVEPVGEDQTRRVVVGVFLADSQERQHFRTRGHDSSP